MKADLKVVTNPAQLAKEAAEIVLMIGTQAIEDRGSFALGVSGGSTPKAAYELLASDAYRSRIDWSKVEIYFADERCVLPDHTDSNYRLVHQTLLSKIPIDPKNVHRMKGEADPNFAAIEYGRMLKARFGDGGLDLLLLGMGEDGHTASLFPHTEALKEAKHRCMAQLVEKSTTGKSWRITMTAPFINRSKNILVLVSGQSKAQTLGRVLNGPRDSENLPIQLIQPVDGPMLWLADSAAAGALMG